MKKRGFCIFWAVLLMVSCFSVARAEAVEYPYYISVNLTDNIVTVYERDGQGKYTVPKKAFFCSAGNHTPTGTFRTSDKYQWRNLIGNVYGQYATRITGHILFHSVPYFKKDKSTLEYEEYNKLGSTASAGCIRMTVEDAKWIYDHCPSGTTVRMYRGKVQEPLQPKAPQKIDPKDAKYRGWDPTDPDPANPWHKRGLRQMTVQNREVVKAVTAYYETGTYYFTAEDSGKLFAHFGLTVALPQDATKISDGKMMVTYQNISHSLTCRRENGKAYYKLRELADMVGASVSWERTEKKIILDYAGEQLFLFRPQEGEGTVNPL